MNLNSAHTQLNAKNFRIGNFSSPSKLSSRNNRKINKNVSLGRIIPLRRESSYKEKLIEQATKFTHQNLEYPDYRITDLSKDLACSQRHLENVIKHSTGLSPVAFVREIRLKKAFELIQNGVFQTIAEVRFEVGMEHPSYFKRKFEERFGISPMELKRNNY